MAASTVSICNAALALIGDAAISSLSEANPRARYCNLFYEPERDAALRELKPASCTSRRVLATLAEVPTWGYTHAFQLPADCRFVLEVDPRLDYRVEGRTLLANTATLNLLYVKTELDPNTFDDGLRDLISARLAVRLSMVRTGSRGVRADAQGAYESALAKARGDTHKEGVGNTDNDARFSYLVERGSG